MPTKTNYAKIGYYYDEFSVRNDAIVLDMINRCLSTGYNGILFELTVPVATDGSLQSNLHFDHMFALASQLQAQGVNTGVLLNWNFNGGNASYVGQDVFSQTRPAEFSMDKMLTSMDQFLRTMALSAQSSGMDLMVIGNNQPDFFANAYYSRWETTIAALRKSYTGKLSVAINSDDKPHSALWLLISIWNLLDEATLWAKPYISEKPLTDPAAILSAYFLSKLDGSSLVNEVISLATKTNKPVDLIFNAMALPNAFDTGWDPTVVQSLQNPLPIRSDLQALAYESFLQVVSQNLSKFVDTISLGNYEPWAVDPALSQPPAIGIDPGDWALWNAFKYFDLSLYPSSLHQVLAQYFKGTWAGLLPELTYGSIGNDVIYTTQSKPLVRLMGGLDQCFGGVGQECYVVSPKVTESKLIVSVKFWLHTEEDLKAAVEIVHKGIVVGSVQAASAVTQFKADSWSDVQALEIVVQDGSQNPDVLLRFAGVSGIAEITSMTLNGSALNVHSGVPSITDRPTWAHDNWLHSGQGLTYALASSENKSTLSQTVIDGGDGVDTIQFDTPRLKSTFAISHDAEGWNLSDVSKQYDTIQATHVERLIFSDLGLALDLDANAGLVAKTLGVVFGKTAVSNKEYAGIGLHFVDELNYGYSSLMQLAINARLGANPTHTQVVDLLYANVVGTAPDAATRKTFTDLLDNHTFTVANLGVLAADTELNKANINLVGLAQTGLEYLPFVG